MDGDRPGQGHFAPVSLPGRRPPVERWAVITAVILVIVVSKPWQSGSRGAGTNPPPTTAPRSPRVTPIPAPSSTRSPEELAAAIFCLDTRTWLIASVERSVERSVDQQIRVWRALEPITSATGPDDPSIPVVSIVSEGVTQLGWCAPSVGEGRPSSTMGGLTTWSRTPNGAVPITLDPSGPTTDRSPYGVMYQPPREGPSSKATLWPEGTYVFRYRAGDGDRWFAIDVETSPLPGSPH